MKALRFYQHGGPECIKVEAQPDPQPGPGEVLVRLRARGINRAELLTLRGHYARLPELPAIPGREGAGEVFSLAENIDTLRVDQRVMLRNGSALGSGTWCELVRVRAEDLIPTPEAISDAQAGGFFVSYLTSWLGLRETIRLKPGDWVIITAATSPTGLAALDLARHFGLNSVATTRQAQRVDFLRAAGATEVVVTTQDDLVAAVKACTQGQGAALAFDAVSGDLGQACFKALKESGTLITYGALSLKPVVIKPGAMIFSQKRIVGLWLTRVLETWPRAELDRVYGELMNLLNSAAISPRVHKSYSFENFAEAWAEMDAHRHLGKVVLTG